MYTCIYGGREGWSEGTYTEGGKDGVREYIRREGRME